jgi:hypothetical protein
LWTSKERETAIERRKDIHIQACDYKMMLAIHLQGIGRGRWPMYACEEFIHFFSSFFTTSHTNNVDGNKKKILRKKLIPIFLEISSFFNSSSAFLVFFLFCCYFSEYSSSRSPSKYIFRERSVSRLHQKKNVK